MIVSNLQPFFSLRLISHADSGRPHDPLAAELLVDRGSPLKRGHNMWDLSPPLGRAEVEEDFRLVAAEFKQSFQV